MTFFDYLKNIFFLLILLQIAPPLIENIQKQYGKYVSSRTKVGVLPITQDMVYNSNDCNKILNGFFADPDIKAILLKIDCSGTAAGTGQAIQNELIELKKQYHKPVIVLVENTCLSGAFYIASAADWIVAPGTAVIGSIGVTLPYFFQLQKFIEQYNIQYVPLKAGKYKNTTDPFVTITPEETDLLQSVLNDSYQQFTADVARNRNLPLSTVNTWADGRIFSGQQALNLGLIDELGSAINATNAIKKKAIIEGDIEWVKPPSKKSFIHFLKNESDDDSDNTLFHGTRNHIYQLCRTFLHDVAMSNGTQIT
jgi:protease-4